jgi:enamine deaminase RidA (YjgF/YER057c/UK114 family)
MAELEVRAVERLAGTGVAYAPAIKAGPWLFLTGHEPFDFEKGAAAEVEGPAGFPSFGAPRLRREAEYVIERMRRLLKEFGADFRNSVRVDQYYPVFDAVRAYQLARHGAFGDYIPPSTSVLMERLFAQGSHISMSMMAALPSKDYEIQKIYPKEVPVPVGSFFVPAITCNDFVFVAGQMASDENAIDPTLRPNPLRNWGGPSPLRRQTEFVIKQRLEPALVAAGSSLAASVKAQIYVPSADDIPDCLDVWNKHMGNIPCAVTIVPTKGYGFVDGIVEINLIALRHDAKRKKEVLKVDLPPMATYGACVRAGELVFPSGVMAIDRGGHVVGNGRAPGLDGLAHEAQLQALAALGAADAVCRAAGTTAANIVRAQYFMTDMRDFAGVELAWMSQRGKQPHPFVAVQVPGTLPAPGARLVADFWVYAP